MLAHTEKGARSAEHYLATSGQLYYSDAHQLADYEDGYHVALDAFLGSPHRATEMISELYVPRDRLADFMADVADDFRRNEVEAIYGTIRLIERDESPAVGPRVLGLRDLQPAHGSHRRRHRAFGGGVSPAHRPRGRSRRLVLLDVPPLGYARAGRALLSAPGLPRGEAPARPRGTLPERLVPAPQAALRMSVAVQRAARPALPRRRRGGLWGEPAHVRASSRLRRQVRARIRGLVPRLERPHVPGNRYFTFRLGNDGLVGVRATCSSGSGRRSERSRARPFVEGLGLDETLAQALSLLAVTRPRSRHVQALDVPPATERPRNAASEALRLPASPNRWPRMVSSKPMK